MHQNDSLKAQLELLVLRMRQFQTPYGEAVHEFRKQFVTMVLRENDANQVKAARELRLHRNTLGRTIAELDIEVDALRQERRPPRAVRLTEAQRADASQRRR